MAAGDKHIIDQDCEMERNNDDSAELACETLVAEETSAGKVSYERQELEIEIENFSTAENFYEQR